jgi:(p)ppGpp synthase/HD superfamily hydrolase
MQTGSPRAKILKLADRLSNLFALGFVHDPAFVRRYLEETRNYILPYAEQINKDMYRELADLIADRNRKLAERLPRD